MEPHKKRLLKQAIGFAVTGSLSTLIMFLLYITLNKIIPYQYSFLLAYSTSVITLYFMNIWLVFKKNISLRSFLMFPLIYVLQYLISAIALAILVHLGFSVTYAPLIIIIILLPLTFLLNRLILLKKR